MVAPPRSAQPKHRRLARPALVAAATAATLALLAFVALPTGANHVQTQTVEGSTFTLQFDHGGDNAYWVEVEVRPLDGDFVAGVQVQVEGEAGMHAMQAQSNTWERQQAGWTKYASSYPYDQVYVPPGKRVKFVASAHDDGGGSAAIASCWFTHPAGVEQCGSSSTTTTTSPPTTGFDPPFTGFRGNEWWVQANVGTGSHCVGKVDVRSNNGAWMPLAKQSWGPTAWAASYRFVQGSVLQMRATSCTGQTDLSSCRQWIPPANQDAAIVACPGNSSTTTTTGPPPAFDATFTNVRGNEYWAEAVITANGNGRINAVLMTNCSTGEESYDMVYNADWGKWVLGRHIPNGSKVYMTAIGDGGSDDSGTYTWPQATPSTPC